VLGGGGLFARSVYGSTVTAICTRDQGPWFNDDVSDVFATEKISTQDETPRYERCKSRRQPSILLFVKNNQHASEL
jgi:hypothetical protein